ncbi:Rmf/CrpP family protein [Sphingomonas phyllosphaerae]|uniref:Rmf/CrpP family protein n=1 Tax=Sphingomonas phyllosphaerae TaxID=257003 RepID=UPI003B50FE0B
MQNAYAEGVRAGELLGSSMADCPYRSALVARERSEWIRGFNASRQDRQWCQIGSTEQTRRTA